MSTLAFDTATRATTVALCGRDGPVLEARDDPPAGERPRHAAQLLPLAARVLEAAGMRWADIERIAVGVGPGTFTGLRIGIATARALAQARAIPLVGVPTLASLALGAWATAQRAGCATVLALIDARRGEVFAAAWPVAGDGEDPAALLVRREAALFGPRPMGPETLAEAVRALGGDTLAVGDGAVPFRGVLERSGALIAGDGAELHQVSAQSHCLLARHLSAGDPESVLPEYLRAPDAEVSHRRRP